MNRLVLIGNGFDLAHGLKTRYKDFITNYLRKALEQFLSGDMYEDDLLELSYQPYFNGFSSEPKVDFSDFVSMKDFILRLTRKIHIID